MIPLFWTSGFQSQSGQPYSLHASGFCLKKLFLWRNSVFFRRMNAKFTGQSDFSYLFQQSALVRNQCYNPSLYLVIADQLGSFQSHELRSNRTNTRMHSSRMHTVRCSGGGGRLFGQGREWLPGQGVSGWGEGVSAQGVSAWPGGCLPGGLHLPPVDRQTPVKT